LITTRAYGYIAKDITPIQALRGVVLSPLRLPRPFRQAQDRRILEELGGIRETLLIYPRRQGQREHPTASCLTRMSDVQQRLFGALGLQQYAPAAS
jgi:hypothetical protein